MAWRVLTIPDSSSDAAARQCFSFGVRLPAWRDATPTGTARRHGVRLRPTDSIRPGGICTAIRAASRTGSPSAAPYC